MNFDQFWLSGPWRKLGKELARRRWKSTIKTPADVDAICLARDRYRTELERRFKNRKWDESVILHGSTFMGLWQDYHVMAVEERTEAIADERECDYCHSSEHLGDNCAERRKDYAELRAKIAAATGKLAMVAKS